MGQAPIDCRRCVQYRVTWVPSFPHECRLFGIRSRALPAVEVQLANGRPCPAFKDKHQKTRES